MSPLIALLCLIGPQQHKQEHMHDGDFKLAIKVVIDDKQVSFPDQQPMMVASHILVPLRGCIEQIGAEIKWDPALQLVTATRGNHHVEITIGRNMAEVDGAPTKLDQPAMTIGGRTMVPLRFLGQSLGAEVDWHPADRTVVLTTSGG